MAELGSYKQHWTTSDLFCQEEAFQCITEKVQNECILQIRVSKKKIKIEPSHTYLVFFPNSPIK